MQNNSFTLLALGDVVGDAGTEAVCRRMISLKKEYGADFVIVNAENSAETYGMSREAANALLDAGADVLTGGNHSLKNYDVFDLLDENERVLRPMNLPDAAPGHGWCIVDAPHGLRVTDCLPSRPADMTSQSATSMRRRQAKRRRLPSISTAESISPSAHIRTYRPQTGAFFPAGAALSPTSACAA